MNKDILEDNQYRALIGMMAFPQKAKQVPSWYFTNSIYAEIHGLLCEHGCVEGLKGRITDVSRGFARDIYWISLGLPEVLADHYISWFEKFTKNYCDQNVVEVD